MFCSILLRVILYVHAQGKMRAKERKKVKKIERERQKIVKRRRGYKKTTKTIFGTEQEKHDQRIFKLFSLVYVRMYILHCAGNKILTAWA